MNKSVFILPFIIAVCFAFGCEHSSKKSLEVPSPPEIPPSKTLTLSQQQLVYLDWHSPNLARARVTEKRILPGPGVEFHIYFPSNSPDCSTIQHVSSGEGGRGVLAGAEVRGYEKFALTFTLVSINGRTEPNEREKVEVGALIGPTAGGRISECKPVTLSLLSSEQSKVAKTPMMTDKIYQIGIYVRLLKSENWNPTGTEMVLRVEPVEDAGFVPLQTTGQP